MKVIHSLFSSPPRKLLLMLMLIVFSNTALGFHANTFEKNRPVYFMPERTWSNLELFIFVSQSFEIHRFWLNLFQGTNVVGQTLIGYATGATQGVDAGIDALYFNDSPLALTSLINNIEYIIQGRSFPFLDTDRVALGFKTDASGTFTIALSNFDGLFLSNQAILLKDNVTGTLQNLKVASYTFTSEIGVFNQRFEIGYRADVTTYQNGAWNNGIPNIELNAVIATDFTSTSNLVAKSLTIAPEAIFTIASGTTLTVENTITNTAGVNNFILESDAVLLQNSTVPNSVFATVKRNSHPLFRLDYTLWSSPVVEPNLRNFSPGTLFNRFFTYNFDTAVNGTYKQEIFSTADLDNKKFILGKGYLIRMPNNWIQFNGGTAIAYSGVFKGLLNNGLITIALYGAIPLVSNGLNLVGNPYPSPISISAFFAANPSLENTLYFWRKPASADPANSSTSGYATYNQMGSVSADWSINNLLFNTIQVGQGFFVRTNSASPADLVFNNDMRINDTTTFFKSTNENTNVHRFWLNLSNDTTVVGQTLIGYKTGATTDVDAGIDALYFNDSPLALTSIVNNSEFIIQGRPLPFLLTDVVPLGFKSNVVGSFTISLAHFDGLFAENQAIYLKDNSTSGWHNLKVADYPFSTSIGIFNNRFEVHYSDLALEISNPAASERAILIGIENHKIIINSGTLLMEKVELIDLAGRIIYAQEDLQATTATIENILASNQLLIVRIRTSENRVVFKKLIF
jgi:hypothetical protein